MTEKDYAVQTQTAQSSFRKWFWIWNLIEIWLKSCRCHKNSCKIKRNSWRKHLHQVQGLATLSIPCIAYGWKWFFRHTKVESGNLTTQNIDDRQQKEKNGRWREKTIMKFEPNSIEMVLKIIWYTYIFVQNPISIPSIDLICVFIFSCACPSGLIGNKCIYNIRPTHFWPFHIVTNFVRLNKTISVSFFSLSSQF